MRGHNRMPLLTQKAPSQLKDKTTSLIYEDLRDLQVCFTLWTKSPTQMLKGERAESELKTQKLLWLEKKPNKIISGRLTHLPPQQPLEEDLPTNGKFQPTIESSTTQHSKFCLLTPTLRPLVGHCSGVETGLGAKSHLSFTKALGGWQGRDLYPHFSIEIKACK